MARDYATGLQHSAGIDYGMGTTNIDHDTSIRYGILPMHEVSQAWCDSSEVLYPEDCDCGDYCMCESTGATYTGDGYEASQDSMGDIFITKSPYYTLCNFCSPCAPGAGYTLSSNHDGIAAYCLGHDWFDDGVAPYPVYDVTTNQEVPAPTQS